MKHFHHKWNGWVFEPPCWLMRSTRVCVIPLHGQVLGVQCSDITQCSYLWCIVNASLDYRCGVQWLDTIQNEVWAPCWSIIMVWDPWTAPLLPPPSGSSPQTNLLYKYLIWFGINNNNNNSNNNNDIHLIF